MRRYLLEPQGRPLIVLVFVQRHYRVVRVIVEAKAGVGSIEVTHSFGIRPVPISEQYPRWANNPQSRYGNVLSLQGTFSHQRCEELLFPRPRCLLAFSHQRREERLFLRPRCLPTLSCPPTVFRFLLHFHSSRQVLAEVRQFPRNLKQRRTALPYAPPGFSSRCRPPDQVVTPAARCAPRSA